MIWTNAGIVYWPYPASFSLDEKNIIANIWFYGNPNRWLHQMETFSGLLAIHDDVIKWKHFPRNWPFVRKIHRSPVNFPHKGQWRGALMFSLINAWINDWANNREAGDLRRYPVHYDVIVMWCGEFTREFPAHWPVTWDFDVFLKLKYLTWQNIFIANSSIILLAKVTD